MSKDELLNKNEVINCLEFYEKIDKKAKELLKWYDKNVKMVLTTNVSLRFRGVDFEDNELIFNGTDYHGEYIDLYLPLYLLYDPKGKEKFVKEYDEARKADEKEKAEKELEKLNRQKESDYQTYLKLKDEFEE